MHEIAKALETVENAARAANGRAEGDYIADDGLLHCGNCRTPKECRAEMFGEMRTLPCMCQCKTEAYQAKRKEMRRKQLEIRRDEAFSAEEMRGWTFSNDDGANAKLTDAMRRYVDAFPRMLASGQGLLLWGNSGTGKTFAACEVANALIDNGYSVFVSSFSRIANVLQDTKEGRQKYINNLNRYHLVVIDDLGVERQTQYMQEIVYNIIDSRYRAGKPMIITTNLDISELKKPSDVSNIRIYDRIIERCFPVEVNGKSRRRQKVCESYDDMRRLLGL